jgi:dipeptidyl aminopeptidase/acylaminoacyl peptidase
MGNPPWKDWGRYLRNSPIFYVDRVQTPLLIVHGDMETAVPIEQAEEFFRALYRQGKRARFVRYWGEGHVLASPANIRDFWHQTYAWLDEFCDISRDAAGNLIFEGDRVKSRKGAPPLKPSDFEHLSEMPR